LAPAFEWAHECPAFAARSLPSSSGFANVTNPNTRGALENEVKDFIRSVPMVRRLMKLPPASPRMRTFAPALQAATTEIAATRRSASGSRGECVTCGCAGSATNL